MAMLRINDIIKEKILVGRESARLLQGPLGAVINRQHSQEIPSDSQPFVIDFAGIEGVAPSFLDELLRVFESLLQAQPAVASRSLTIANPPTRLSSKFEAIARAHGMTVRVRPDGSWLLTDTRKPCV